MILPLTVVIILFTNAFGTSKITMYLFFLIDYFEWCLLTLFKQEK